MSQNNPQKVKYPVYASTQQRVEQTVPHMLENQRRLSLIGHPDFGQAGYPQQYGFPQGLPTVPSNSAHDMSKQVPAGQPGMYPNSGGIPTASQQHHQPGMGAPAPSPQPPPMVQPGQQINRGHNMSMSNYYARTSAPRTIPNMARNPLTNVVNQTAQQPSSQYSQPVHMVPSHASFNQMPAVLLNHHHLAHMYQQRPYSPPQYSIISPGPAAVYVNSWNNYSNPTPPNTNGYYPSTPISSFNTIPPPPVSNHMPPPTTKLRKNAIPIINPDTGEDVLNRLNDEDSSRPQLEKEAENVGTNISIQFAAQVAAALANDQKNESLPKSTPVEDRRILDPQPPVLCPSEIEILSNIEQVENTELHEVCEPYIDNRNITCTDEPNIAFFKKDDNITENTFENEKIIPETVESVQTTENRDSDTYSALPDATVHENIYETKTDNVPLHDVSESEKNVGYYGVQETNKTTVQLTTETVPNKTHSMVETTPANLVTEENKTVQSNGDVSEVLVSSGSSKSTEKSSVESKKNKTKKKKDLNKKGESKEGGEMDAFLDKGEEVTSVASQVPAPPPVTSVSPVSEERIPSPVTIVDSEILSSIPLPEETSAVSTPQNDISPSEPTSETSSVSPSAESEDKENISEDAQSKIVLKYNYKEDQWSPLNPEGKKQYDRDFLLQLQSQPMSLCKPNNLPNLEVIKDKAHIQKLTEVNRTVPVSLPVRAYADPFMPTYARGGVPRPPHPTVNRRSQPGRGEKPKKIISFSSSLTQNIKLHESENAWKPSHKVEKPADEIAESQDLYRKVRGILNKLTPQKFETLVGQVKTLSINTEEKLKGVIDLVFEKAIDEPNFSVPYANMCKQLALIKVPLAGQPGQQVNFRKLLLTKCQKEFEQDRTDELKRKDRIKAIESADPEKKKELQLEYDEEEKKMRYRQLGNIRFIGELFKLNMLIEPIMHECIKKLLSQQDEESLECLCRLLKTIGKELDEGKSNKAPRDTNLMDGYFAEMQRIVDKRLTSSRVRFMLQDVIDLKKNNWIPRRDENNPKTIDQIHKEAEREAREQQQVFSNMNYSKRMPDDRDRRKSAARNLGQSEEGWIPSSKSNKGSYNVVDPNKLKLTKPDEVESIRLGPGGRGLQSWGRGSSGGTKTSGDSDAKTPLANRYSALADQNLTPNYEARRGAQRSAASSRESSRGRNNPMTPPVRKTPSTSKERENLLETVKGLASRTGVSEPKAQDVKRNPESLLNGKAVDGPAVALRGVELSEDDVEKKTKPLIDEFLHNGDFEEAIKCVTELASPTTVHYFINSAINQVLERSSQSRYLLGQLLCSLEKKKIITLEQYKKGFCGILENLDDYALDIPLIWEYIGEILEPIIEDNKLPLTFLKDVLEPCIPSQTAGKLVSAVLHCAAKKKGTIKLGELWRESGLQWTDFLGSSANVDDFIHSYKLEFTISPTKILPNTEMSPEDIKKNLKILLEKTEESEEIFDWIDANVSQNALTEPSFIRALVTAVHEDAITGTDPKYELDSPRLKKRIPLLTRYIDHNGNLELQALYAIQALMNQLNQPKGILRQIFDILYDDDVITEETFKLWEQSNDPNELEGKGVAVQSVKSFFTWLREAESGESVDDE